MAQRKHGGTARRREGGLKAVQGELRGELGASIGLQSSPIGGTRAGTATGPGSKENRTRIEGEPKDGWQ